MAKRKSAVTTRPAGTAIDIGISAGDRGRIADRLSRL